MDTEEIKELIRGEIKNIAESYKVPESRVALYTGKRFIWFKYCTREQGYALEKLSGENLLNEIIRIASSKETEKEFDYKKFFLGVDGDLMEDFAVLALPKLSVWDEMMKELENKKKK